MSTIKPVQIKQVLDTALKIRAINGNYVPCFSGDSGIGKSKVVQAWAKAQGPDFGFIDIRLAYMEGPDMVGMPAQVQINGKYTTIHALPDFLPKEGSGILFFEEPNRAHESVMNTMMQILTDRSIHKYDLPAGWIMAAAINPEGRYNVNTMDGAMKNRFAMFEVKYDHNSFVTYMKSAGFDSKLVAFADSGLWVYKAIEEVGDQGHYISPRSFELANSLLKVETSPEINFELMASVFGKATTSDFFKFVNEIRPILIEDFLKDEEEALERLKKTGKGEYAGDLLSATVNSLIDAFTAEKCDERLIFKVVNIIDKDHATNLLMNTFSKFDDEKLKALLSKSNKDPLVVSVRKRLKGVFNE